MASNVKIYVTGSGGSSGCGCNTSPCGCNNNAIVICQPCTPSAPTSNSITPCTGECVDLLDFKCIIYNGAAIPSIGVTTASTLLTIIAQLGTEIADLKARVTALEEA